MPELDQYTELPTFFAPGAFADTRVNYTGIYYDPDLLSRASDFMEDEIGRGLPANPDDVAFVYRFAEPGYIRPEPKDPNYFKAAPATLYIPSGQLALDPTMRAARVSKADIRAIGKTVVQVQVGEAAPPSVSALAESILYPPAEDHRMNASLAAWGRQFKEAFRPSESVGHKRRIIEEVTARYSGAILLQPRQRRAT